MKVNNETSIGIRIASGGVQLFEERSHQLHDLPTAEPWLEHTRLHEELLAAGLSHLAARQVCIEQALFEGCGSDTINSAIAALPNLRQVTLDRCHITDPIRLPQTVSKLKLIDPVKSMGTIHGCLFTIEVRPLKALAMVHREGPGKLTILHVVGGADDMTCRAQDVRTIAKLRPQNLLSFSELGLSLKVLRQLVARCPNDLAFHDCVIWKSLSDDGDLNAVAETTQLHLDMVMTQTQLTTFLGFFPKVSSLTLPPCKLTKSLLSRLATMDDLTFLDISQTVALVGIKLPKKVAVQTLAVSHQQYELRGLLENFFMWDSLEVSLLEWNPHLEYESQSTGDVVV
ncbi:MAG: hypothetical protein HONBIEJF_02601 [Fimbriimonadaceae bacterium]|nr:hypothetical protein [Fimbriimonadaceae bacterium]